MKFYKREIKPYIKPPCVQGSFMLPHPVEGYDWVSEDLEEKLKNEIITEDPWSQLIFEERYVEFKPVLCKDCQFYIPYDKPTEDFDGRCSARCCETDEGEFCSYSINSEMI